MKIQIKKIETKIRVQKYVMRVPTKISFEKKRPSPTSKGKNMCFEYLKFLEALLFQKISTNNNR
jgi:hypothetical protein